MNNTNQQIDVLLICMPFGNLLRPSLSLSLFKTTLTALDVSTKVLYPSIPFAKKYGLDTYNSLVGSSPDDMMGEYIFTPALYDEIDLDPQDYIDQVLRDSPPVDEPVNKRLQPVFNKDIESLPHIMKETNTFIDECLSEVSKFQPRVVGFTTSFQQNVSSLALAKRIKKQNPDIFIVFGGANCEGPMGIEIARQFPFVDAVVSGEGDEVFPEIVQRILADRCLSGLQGVYTQKNISSIPDDLVVHNTHQIRNMDALPLPDFDDYFEQLKEHKLAHFTDTPILMFETSRGCWWGQKHHCTFCGLNGNNMGFRSKSSDRILNELMYFKNKYPDASIQTTDNILDMKYFKTILPEIIKKGYGYRSIF